MSCHFAKTVEEEEQEEEKTYLILSPRVGGDPDRDRIAFEVLRLLFWVARNVTN